MYFEGRLTILSLILAGQNYVVIIYWNNTTKHPLKFHDLCFLTSLKYSQLCDSIHV